MPEFIAIRRADIMGRFGNGRNQYDKAGDREIVSEQNS